MVPPHFSLPAWPFILWDSLRKKVAMAIKHFWWKLYAWGKSGCRVPTQFSHLFSSSLSSTRKTERVRHLSSVPQTNKRKTRYVEKRLSVAGELMQHIVENPLWFLKVSNISLMENCLPWRWDEILPIIWEKTLPFEVISNSHGCLCGAAVVNHA